MPVEWQLDQDAWNRLLASLDGDADRAALLYEELRRKLIRFFDWNGAASPEELTDITLDRLTRKLQENMVAGSVQSFAYGIARLVLREQWKIDSRFERGGAALLRERATEREIENGLIERLRECLAKLSRESRELILAYYDEDKIRKVKHRQDLATALGVPLTTLRLRAHRLRARLENCVNNFFAMDRRNSPDN